ncbi:hypothetical protein K5X82_12575 [Halosquirtibacter xylanolyticus]|uniref:Crp/Fnr family transcriptional regulator n=1 Tax=Halosquirtibacter xylanolyticus TaxID=3374599 RepID=UPI003749A8A6|nr:hypothetical protein K5X82_12575 [Prolixibacteraceae bacterium]
MAYSRLDNMVDEVFDRLEREVEMTVSDRDEVKKHAFIHNFNPTYNIEDRKILPQGLIYIISGTIRSFYYDDNGDINTGIFFTANDCFLFSKDIPQGHFIHGIDFEVMEPAQCLIIPGQTISKLRHESIVYANLCYLLTVVNLSKFFIEERTYRPLKPYEKYKRFVKEHPELIDRISQRAIASYLGVTPVSLSRLKRRYLDDFDGID